MGRGVRFKTGDKVRCVYDNDQAGLLKVGEVYTVSSYYREDEQVYLKEVVGNIGWKPWRFELVEEEVIDSDTPPLPAFSITRVGELVEINIKGQLSHTQIIGIYDKVFRSSPPVDFNNINMLKLIKEK